MSLTSLQPQADLDEFEPQNPTDEYAWSVARGEIPAGRYHRACCERHIRDRRREGNPDFPFVFVWAHAHHFLKFANKCRHYKGEWAGQRFNPSPNQIFRLGNIFGWRDAVGLRRFTTAYIEIPRKNGKTFEAAIVALYSTFFEHEPGAEGYCIATKREQAKRVWDDCKRLVVSSGLRQKIVALASNLNRPDIDAKLEPLGADADSTDGLNPHCIITDEFHAMKNRALIDVMETATGARRNPLHYQITTAGNDLVSPCGDQHEYATKVLNNVVADEHFFAFIAHADPGDDWSAEETWRKANPHYDVCVKPDDMRKLALKAKHMPAAIAQFKQKRLDEWVNAMAPSLSMDGWKEGQSNWDLKEMVGEKCYGGVDLSSKIDLCALSLLFPPQNGRTRWRVALWVWSPADTLRERALRDRAPYDIWASQGWMIASPGSVVNHKAIREQVAALKKDYAIQSVGFDPWHAEQIAIQMKEEDGWPDDKLIEVPQTFAALTSAESSFKAAVLSGLVDARNSPVAAWSASNVVEQLDGKANILFSKKYSRGRIDPIKATTIAWALAERSPSKPPTYDIIIVGRAHGQSSQKSVGGGASARR